MKLTISCQVCGKILCTVDKDQVNDDDIQSYQQNCACDDHNQDNIQATMTQE